MPDQLQSISGVAVLVCAANGTPVGAEPGPLNDLIGDAYGQRAQWVVLPVNRLDQQFFTLRSGVAGEVVQKFSTYRLRLAVVGDIARQIAASAALRDFVREANRGTTVWFVADLDELTGRLLGSTPSR